MKSQDKVVVIGGGSGLSVLLRGLKQLTAEITAVVTVADDGGSSGVLRSDLGMLPPGDIRNCIIALSETEPIMQELMQYRFKEGKLKGHSLGNMLIAGLVDLSGSYDEALTRIHEIFAVTGRVMPVSTDNVTLYARMKNGIIVKGESNIPTILAKHKTKIDRVFLEPQSASAYEASIQAVLEADVIMIGPGSLYTSIIPNLMIEPFQNALKKSRAKKVAIMNLMTQPGETDLMSVVDHLNAIHDHSSHDLIDAVIVNSGQVAESTVARYHEQGAQMLSLDDAQKRVIESMGIEVIEGNFYETVDGYIRHDALEVSRCVLNLIDTKQYIVGEKTL